MWKWFGKQVHQSWIIVWLCIGVIVGTILGIVFRINYFASPTWIVVVFSMLIIAYLKPKCAFIMMSVVAGTVLAFVRIASELSGESYIRGIYGYEIIVSGTIDGDPETDDNSTKLKLTDLHFGEEEIRSTGSIYVTMEKNEALSREDRIVLNGKIQDGFGTYAGAMYRPRLVKWERPEPGSWVLSVRNWFANRIRQLIPEPEVQLGLSYLLGLKTELPDKLNENLRIVGLTHIIVASGTHLSILVEVARKIFGKLSRFAGVLSAVLFTVFFMAMVGWTPSILRAGSMTVLTLVAWYSGRVMSPWRLIVMVMAVTLLAQPNFIINMGWQLSFASYAGIMLLGPRLVKFFFGMRKPGIIGSLIITTISATMMTLPITLYHYGTMSLISVIANLLILPTMSWAMGMVFVVGVVAGMPIIELVLAWCATKVLDFHVLIVNWFATKHEFLIEIPKHQVFVFIIYSIIGTGFLASIIVKLIKRKNMLKLKHE